MRDQSRNSLTNDTTSQHWTMQGRDVTEYGRKQPGYVQESSSICVYRRASIEPELCESADDRSSMRKTLTNSYFCRDHSQRKSRLTQDGFDQFAAVNKTKIKLLDVCAFLSTYFASGSVRALYGCG